MNEIISIAALIIVLLWLLCICFVVIIDEYEINTKYKKRNSDKALL